MELNEGQRVRAQKLAEAVGNDPGKYFSDALKATIKKGNNEINKLLVSSKLKLGEKYAQVGQLAEQTKTEIGVIKEAYRVWYEKSGKDLVAQEKTRLKTSFDNRVEEFEALCAVLRKDAAEIAEILKKK